MKISFAALALVLAVAAGHVRGDDEVKAVGKRDKSGAPTGDYKIVDARGDTVAEGKFVKGRMDGLWTFFESTGVKVAEITYSGGARTGPYRTFAGSHFDPRQAGKLESEGHLLNGRMTGRFIAYDTDGSVTDSVMFAAGAVVNVTTGNVQRAKTLAAADLRFIDTLEQMVLDAVK